MGGGGGDGGMLDVNQMMQTTRQMGMGGPQQRQKVWLEQGIVVTWIWSLWRERTLNVDIDRMADARGKA